MAGESTNVGGVAGGTGQSVVQVPFPAVSPDGVKQIVFYLALIAASFAGGHHYANSGRIDQCPGVPPGYQIVPVSPGQAPVQVLPVVPVPAAPGRRVEGRIDPQMATCRLEMGNVRCSGTVLYPQPAEGEYFFLSACHCVKTLGATGTVVARDTGRRYPCFFLARLADSDLSLGLIRTGDALCMARVADVAASVGTSVWHCGFGVDKPGNREAGRVIQAVNDNGKAGMILRCSSGDSGSGVFRSDTGELCAVVCCGDRRGHTWGGGVAAIKNLIENGYDTSLAGRYGRFLRRFVGIARLF